MGKQRRRPERSGKKPKRTQAERGMSRSLLIGILAGCLVLFAVFGIGIWFAFKSLSKTVSSAPWFQPKPNEVRAITLPTDDLSPQSLHFGPDGKTFVSASWSGALRIWDRESGSQLKAFSASMPSSGSVIAALSSDGRECLSTTNSILMPVELERRSDRPPLILIGWSVESGKETKRFEIPTHDGPSAPQAAFSPDGSRLLLNDGETARLVDTAIGAVTSSVLYLPAGNVPLIHQMGRLHWFDGRRMLIAHQVQENNKRLDVLEIWDLDAKKMMSSCKLPYYTACAVPMPAFDAVIFGAASVGNTINDETGEVIIGDTQSWFGRIDVQGQQSTFPYKGNKGAGLLALSPNGKRLLSLGAGNVVSLWDVSTGELLHEFKGHKYRPEMRKTGQALVFAPDGQFALSASVHDLTIRIMSIPDSQEPR